MIPLETGKLNSNKAMQLEFESNWKYLRHLTQLLSIL